jgi:acyl transferase domain-containing protein
MTKPESIAVIGVGCRYPGASGMDALWELMRDGRDVLGPAPEGRYTGLGESEMGRRLRGLRGGFLDGIDLFDPGAFNISPREARVMDPQQRLLLETAWEALEDAGQDMRALAGKPAGVFVGVWGSDYQTRLFRAAPGIDIATTTGGGRYAAAGRLSYAFDFRGPSLTIDTACSSSLVSIHMACQALRTGECGLAIAGGVNVILDPSVTIGYLTSGALSPGGACKFGDASADGYARSEGVGLVVLKLLSAAIADQDRIHAIIRGSAVTHSGQTGDSLLAPGEEAQAELIERALAMAGIGAAELDYIEAHGTGTRVGDRVELRALGKVLRAGGRQAEAPCLIGSIKTNIGHTESAAGAAGLIKAILCLKHREVPASLHFKEPNPEIPWSELPLRVVTRQTPMRSGSGPAYAGVNSFGITGTFAHIILEGAPAAATRASTGEQPVIVPVSARSSGALARLAGEYAKRIRASPGGLADIAYSAALRRTHHEWRFAAAGRDAETISAELTAFAGDGVGGAKTRPKVAWVFSGQGPQWAGMGMRLFQTEPVFRAALERLDGLIAAESGWSLLEVLQATGDASRLHLTACAQPAIFAIQIGLAELLQAWGLRPDMVVGHSVGEAAAACVAGVISLQDAVKIICARGRLMEEAAGLG